VPGQAVDDLADLGWIENDRDHFHPASTHGTGHDVQFVHLGEQPCPCFPAGQRADFLILRGIRGRGRLSGLSAIPVLGRASAECGAVFPGPASAGGIQAIAAHQVAAPGRDVQGHLGDEVQTGEVTLPEALPAVSRSALDVIDQVDD